MRAWPQADPAARFTCPIAPSVNNLFVNRGGQLATRAKGSGRVKGADYRRWLHDAGWTIKLQKPPPVAGLVAILIEAPLHRRRDLDNALKPCLDLIVKLGLIEDDNLVDDLRIARAGFGADMTISIWPLAAG